MHDQEIRTIGSGFCDRTEDVFAGKKSVVDRVREAIAKIRNMDPAYHSFVTLCEERAFTMARELDDQLQGLSPEEARRRYPLAGLVFAVKDNICVEGVRTTAASHMLENYISPYSSTAVVRLEEAGAICVGKTNMDEFAMGQTTTTGAFGATKNPRYPELSAGGSSGGSAAAVALGLVDFALGSDTGGSIRQPAALCGVVGLKPAYGTVSRYGLISYASAFDGIGPLTRSVTEAQLVYSVIAGPDAQDASMREASYFRFSKKDNHGSLDCEVYCEQRRSANAAEIVRSSRKDDQGSSGSGTTDDRDASMREVTFVQPSTEKTRGRLRIGVLRGEDPAVSAALRKEPTFCEKYEIEYVELPMLEYAVATYYILACAQAASNLARYDGVRYGFRADGCATLEQMYEKTRAEGFSPEVQRRIRVGRFVLGQESYRDWYEQAARVRRMIYDQVQKALANVDVIVSETRTQPYPRADFAGDSASFLAGYEQDKRTVLANLCGLPAISVSVAATGEDAPRSVMVMAGAGRESAMFTVAEQLAAPFVPCAKGGPVHE